MYKLQSYTNEKTEQLEIVGVYKQTGSNLLCIPFDPANTDYQTFKAQINADEAELEDTDGNLMTADEAKAFISELP